MDKLTMTNPEQARQAQLAFERAKMKDVSTWTANVNLKPTPISPEVNKLEPKAKYKLFNDKYKLAHEAQLEYVRLSSNPETKVAASEQGRKWLALCQEVKALYALPEVVRLQNDLMIDLEKPTPASAKPAQPAKLTAPRTAPNKPPTEPVKKYETVTPTSEEQPSNSIKLYSEYVRVPNPDEEIAAITKFCQQATVEAQKPGLPKLDIKNIHYSPDEAVMSLITQYRLYKQIDDCPRLTDEQLKSATALHDDLPGIQHQAALLWSIPGVRGALEKTYKRMLTIDQGNEGAVQEWSDLQRRKHELTTLIHQTYKKRFNHSQQKDTKGRMMEYGDYFNTQVIMFRHMLEKVEENIDSLYQRGGMPIDDFDKVGNVLDKEHADQAALLAYQKIRCQREQMLDPNIRVTIPKSREKILNEIIEIISNNKWPLMIGETGSGKTSFANIIAYFLTGKSPVHVVGHKDVQVKDYISTPQIRFEGQVQRSYDAFSALTFAATGFRSSIEFEAHPELSGKNSGYIWFVDETGEIPPEVQSGTLKPIEGRKQGDPFPFPDLLPPLKDTLRFANGWGILGATNYYGERYGRAPMRPTEERLWTYKIPIPYLPMEFSKNPAKLNDELYQFFLAVLMNNNGDMRVNPLELKPAYKEKTGTDKITRFELEDETSKEHGVLLRFALAVGQMHRNFDGRVNVLSDKSYEQCGEAVKSEDWLTRSVLDQKTLRDWMEEYKEIVFKGISLDYFLREKLYKYYKNIDKEFSSDKEIIKRIFEPYGFKVDEEPLDVKSDPTNKNFHTALISHTDIGYFLPSTPRHVIKEGEIPTPTTTIAPHDQGVYYVNVQPIMIGTKTIKPQSKIKYLSSTYVFVGLDAENQNNIVIQTEDKANAKTIPISAFV